MTSDHVAIVADSSASLPPEIVERERIIIVPISTVLDGKTYLDGELPAGLFYERLESSTGRAVTTSPAPRQFVEAFRRARDSGASAVLCLIMSSQLSATFRVAESAAEIARSDLEIPIRVVDTHGLAMTHGFAVITAAEALRSGRTIDQAAAEALRVGSSAELAGVLDTMRYLAKGGRVPRIVHWAASALQVKPVLAWSSGRARTIARPRTIEKALDHVVEYARNRAGYGRLRVAAMHAAAPATAAALTELVLEKLPVSDVLVAEFTSAMGVHTGPGFAGLAFHAE
jgi:DegV family protein with EDD domain